MRAGHREAAVRAREPVRVPQRVAEEPARVLLLLPVRPELELELRVRAALPGEPARAPVWPA